MKTFLENAKFYHEESVRLTMSLSDDGMDDVKVGEVFSMLGSLQGAFAALLELTKRNPGARADLQAQYEKDIPRAKDWARQILKKMGKQYK